jgi:hypothetical protein
MVGEWCKRVFCLILFVMLPTALYPAEVLVIGLAVMAIVLWAARAEARLSLLEGERLWPVWRLSALEWAFRPTQLACGYLIGIGLGWLAGPLVSRWIDIAREWFLGQDVAAKALGVLAILGVWALWQEISDHYALSRTSSEELEKMAAIEGDFEEIGRNLYVVREPNGN